MRKYGKSLLVVFISLSFVAFILRCTGTARGENPQTPAQLWLSWSLDARAEYVWGFLSGFQEGKLSGCSFYAVKITPYTSHKPMPPEKLPKLVCINALPDFQKPSQTYIAAVTSYYTKYPRDREAGMPRLLMELASHPALTIDDIHSKLAGSVLN